MSRTLAQSHESQSEGRPSYQIIIPTHVRDRPIRRAVESVLEDASAGAIVVAHNVRPETLDVPTDPRVTVVAFDGSKGRPGASFDAGIAAATAPWVGIMGSDDWYESGALEAMFRHATHDAADVVLAPIAYQSGERGLLPRTLRNRDLKPVRDRLFYRTAPLGLYKRAVIQKPDYKFDDRYSVGEDIRVSTRLWTSNLKVSYYPRDPAYVVGSDAKMRVTLKSRPLAESGAAWLGIWDEPWVRSLSEEIRTALAIKILRVHVLGAIEQRPEKESWSKEDFSWLSALARRIVAEAPSSLAPFRRSTSGTLQALLAGDLEGTIVAHRGDHSSGMLQKLISTSPSAFTHREAPMRWIGVSATEKMKSTSAAFLASTQRCLSSGGFGRGPAHRNYVCAETKRTDEAHGPTMLIVSFSPIVNDARVLRQVNLFKDECRLITVGFGPAPEGVHCHVELDRTLLPTDLDGRLISLKQYRLAYWAIPAVHEAWERLRGIQVDCILANDIETLPIAVRLKPKCGILADFHEHYPSLHEYDRAWKRRISPYYSWLIGAYAKRANAVTTVSSGLQKAYVAQFGFDVGVVPNATPYADLVPIAVREPIRLVHSGACQRKRHLEIMLEAVQNSNANVTLDLFITPNDPAYLQELKDRYSADPRVTFNDPVPYADLISTLNKFDVGVFVLPPATFSYKWALPNKFFDFIQARLGIVVGPSSEMASIVKELGNGGVSEGFDPASLQLVLEELTIEKVAKWKASSNDAACDMGADRQSAGWVDAVRAILTECDPSSNARPES